MSIDWHAKARTCRVDARSVIAGRRIEMVDRNPIEKASPRDGQRLYEVARSGASLVDAAVANARATFEAGHWSRASARHRKERLLRLADLIERDSEEFALLECLDAGKPISNALSADVPTAAAVIRFAAEAADKLYGAVYGSDPASLSYELHRPYGVVGAIIGWNFPLVLAAQKIGPALATGNSLVLKPSELAVLSACRLAELALEAGIPEGVLNVVSAGAGAGSALAHHDDVDLLSFTGSTETGKRLMRASADSNMKRLILECGGKAPNVIFDDAPDLSAVADAAVARAFWNQGQVCTAGSRLLIQRGIRDQLLPMIAARMRALVPGDPLEPTTRFGALISQDHAAKVQGYVDEGRRLGLDIYFEDASREPPVRGGSYVTPLMFSDVHPDATVAQEEIFGPVLCAVSFQDEEEAIRLANATRYGLSAIVWTRDLGRAHRMASTIDAGWIALNATAFPNGGLSPGALAAGGHKHSGLGLEGGLQGLSEYQRRTAVQYFV